MHLRSDKQKAVLPGSDSAASQYCTRNQENDINFILSDHSRCEMYIADLLSEQQLAHDERRMTTRVAIIAPIFSFARSRAMEKNRTPTAGREGNLQTQTRLNCNLCASTSMAPGLLFRGIIIHTPRFPRARK
jgi:hypothetical protein